MDDGTNRTMQREALRRYRVLAEQPHSVSLEQSTSFSVTVAGYDCAAFLKPVHTAPSEQRTHGRGFVHLEFSAETNDLVRAAALGMRLIEPVLAGLGVITNVPFGLGSLVQILDVTTPTKTRFLFAFTPEYRHCDEPITENQLRSLQHMLAHWDGLARGDRIRRAATLYRRALKETRDDVAAFQYGFMGLEALEPVLAEQQSVSSGSELSIGKCEGCGVEYEKRRTVLNGVRAYITRPEHPSGKDDWKDISKLRHNLFHSLEDWRELSSRARHALPAVAHYLHDAICCVSHAHDLEVPTYQIPRIGTRLVMIGDAEPGIDDSIEECRLVLESPEVGWDRHPEHQWLPKVDFRKCRPSVEIGVDFYWLPVTLKCESETCLEEARIEAG